MVNFSEDKFTYLSTNLNFVPLTIAEEPQICFVTEQQSINRQTTLFSLHLIYKGKLHYFSKYASFRVRLF